VNPLAVDLSEVPRRATAREEVHLLSVGRLVSWKGVDTALTALAQLRAYRWRFDIVGEGDSRPQLERQAQELGLTDRVHFHGFQDDLARWYRNADLFLFPSRCESQGLVMLEAMSYGLPCLAIRPDEVRYLNVNDETIDDGRTGLLADDETDFTRKLEKVLKEPAQLDSLGEAAREEIANRFSWEKHLVRYEQLFDELITGRKPSAVEHPVALAP
jgi:glycosyltransferase involved in cell wall biosynthesis